MLTINFIHFSTDVTSWPCWLLKYLVSYYISNFNHGRTRNQHCHGNDTVEWVIFGQSAQISSVLPEKLTLISQLNSFLECKQLARYKNRKLTLNQPSYHLNINTGFQRINSFFEFGNIIVTFKKIYSNIGNTLRLPGNFEKFK